MQGNLEETLQRLALRKKDPAMYKTKDRSDGYLFKELSPFGGQLDSENRWLKIKAVIPWEDLNGNIRSTSRQLVGLRWTVGW